MNENPDRGLSRLYRAGARELPPRWLDEAVLDQAIQDGAPAKSAGRQSARMPWRASFALAAVLVLAVSLALVVDHESGSVSSVSSRDAPAAPSPDGSPPGGSAAEPGTERGAASPRAEPVPEPLLRPPLQASESQPRRTKPMESDAGAAKQQPLTRERTARPAPPTPSAPESGTLSAPAETAPYDRLEQPSRAETAKAAGRAWEPARAGQARATEAAREAEAVTERPAHEQAPARNRLPAPATANRERMAGEERRDVTQGVPSAKAEAPAVAQPAPAAPPSPTSPESVVGAAPAAVTPEQLLKEIEQLRREGRMQEARERMDAFRRRYPDHPLPPGLQ